MRRKVNVFLVAVDEDGVPGFNAGDRAPEDIQRFLENALEGVSHYSLQVSFVGGFDRASNFVRPVEIYLNVSINTDDDIPVSHCATKLSYEREQG